MVDLLLLILLMWAAYSGFKRGLIQELFSLSAFALASLGSTQLLDAVMVQSADWGYPLEGGLAYLASILVFALLLMAQKITQF